MRAAVTQWFLYAGLLCNLAGCITADATLKSVLPESQSLNLIGRDEIGLATISDYSLDGALDLDRLFEFPHSRVIKTAKKSLIKWHRPTEQELEDIRLFVNEELKGKDVSVPEKNDSFIAVIYDSDKVPPGGHGYSIYYWMELYMLDMNQKKLTHISYGKF